MSGYKDFPPHPYFMQVLRHFPDAAMLYCKIWGSRNNQNKLAIKKSDIFNAFLLSPTLFRNQLVKLMEEGLVSFETTPKFYYVECVGFDEETFTEGDNEFLQLS